MKFCKKDTFWLEKITQLFCNYTVIPLSKDSLEEQLNSITRLVLLVWLLLLLFNYKNSLVFLLISLIFIIIMYYIKRNTMREKYENVHHSPVRSEYNNATYGSKPQSKFCKKNQHDIFCKDGVPIGRNKHKPSINQRLAYGQNPKTLEKPVIVARSHDLDHWKTSALTTHSGINTSKPFDEYNSGYVTVSESVPNTLKERFQPLTTGCCLNKNSSKNGLAINMDVPHCMNTPAQRQRNQQVFTSVIQPGVYTNTDVNEPLNTNIGISMTPQFPHLKRQFFNNGDVNYERTYFGEDEVDEQTTNTNPTEYNVYDPRFTGYGTHERTYIDPLLGQPKYFYDDVNAIRMPNYITRSKVDHQSWAEAYGPQRDGGPIEGNYRKDAHKSWLRDTTEFRTDLQERLMRKNNSVNWQRKMAPISTAPRR